MQYRLRERATNHSPNGMARAIIYVYPYLHGIYPPMHGTRHYIYTRSLSCSIPYPPIYWRVAWDLNHSRGVIQRTICLNNHSRGVIQRTICLNNHSRGVIKAVQGWYHCALSVSVCRRWQHSVCGGEWRQDPSLSLVPCLFQVEPISFDPD